MRVEFPDKLEFLFEPSRYKVLYGGRGGLKSWSIARGLVSLGSKKPLRILCARELMKSIAESVHQLLQSQIELLGLADFYRVEKAAIYGANGTQFAFTGLRDAHNLKSYEGFDIVWVEEANNVSKRSWDMLIPTIRKKGSEIWISFNPELDTDETYKRFVLKPPPNAVTVKTNWRDNPWLSDELKAEKDHCELTTPDDYLTIWEGHCKQTLDGAIYAHEMRAAMQDGRITRVPYVAGVPVQVFFDLGIADQTAMWFAQAISFEFRFVDFYQNRNQPIGHYLKELQARPYVYSWLWLPHDGQRRDLGTGKSVENHCTQAGYRVKIVPNIGLKNGLDATRNMFARSWFDEEKCADGLNCLRRYRWQVDPDTRIYSKQPLHDDNSNGADAFRYAGVALTEPQRKQVEERRQQVTKLSVWS